MKMLSMDDRLDSPVARKLIGARAVKFAERTGMQTVADVAEFATQLRVGGLFHGHRAPRTVRQGLLAAYGEARWVRDAEWTEMAEKQGLGML